MPNPGKGVPRAMSLTILIGMLTAFMWTLAFMFSTSDLDAVSMSHLPILTVYYQALGSKAGAVIFAAWLLFICESLPFPRLIVRTKNLCINDFYADYGATIGCFLAAGRQTWTFARDNGLPHSRIFAKIHPTLQVPVNATFTTLIFCVLYGLIYIGSTTAYNSFINLSILSLNITYTIPQAVVVIRGRDKVLPKRQFNLGPVLGPICNTFSVIWMLVFTVLFCFPVFLPVTLQNMNYLSVVVAAVCLFILILWWGGKRKTFEGPHVELAGDGIFEAVNSY